MQMCPDCGRIYDESDYAKCPYCGLDAFIDNDADDDNYELEEYVDPGYDYVYDEDGNSVSCPCCGAEELRYNNGCCCIECESEFTDQEIEDYAGPWHHG